MTITRHLEGDTLIVKVTGTCRIASLPAVAGRYCDEHVKVIVQFGQFKTEITAKTTSDDVLAAWNAAKHPKVPADVHTQVHIPPR